MSHQSDTRNITRQYATLREELLREQNWVTAKLTRLQVLYIGLAVGAVLGAIVGIFGVYVVYRVMIFF